MDSMVYRSIQSQTPIIRFYSTVPKDNLNLKNKNRRKKAKREKERANL